MKRLKFKGNVVGAAMLISSVVLSACGSSGRVPSVTWRVRACPDGTNSVRRLWQGISPIVKAWECGGREAACRRLGLSQPTARKRATSSCRLPQSSAPVPVFVLGAEESPTVDAKLLARGYAVVRGEEIDYDGIAANSRLDATRIAVVGSGSRALSSLREVARDERLAMVVPCFAEGDKAAAEKATAELLQLVAPRLVYGVGVADSTWGEVGDFYRAYGVFDRAASAASLDWEKVLDFADRHLKAPSDADSDEIDRRLAAAGADGSRCLTLARNPRASDGVWRITRAILVPDNFTLIFDGCRVELVDRAQDNLVRNAGAAEGASRPNRGLRILGRNGAVLSGGTRNHYLPARSGDPNGWRSVGILLCDVSDYEIGGFAMEETQCWAISQERCHHGRLHDLEFGSSDIMFNQDGIDFRKGCHDVVVENITGCAGDDVVALTAYHSRKGEPPKYGMQIGGNADLGADDDVYNITIRNVQARCSGGHGVIRLLTCDGINMHHITVSNVVDTASGNDKRPQATIRVGDISFHRVRTCRMGEMHHITVKEVTASGPKAVWVRGPICDSEITGITPSKGGKRYVVSAPTERTVFDAE